MFSTFRVFHCPTDNLVLNNSGPVISTGTIPPRYKGNYGPNFGKGNRGDAKKAAPFAPGVGRWTKSIRDGLSKTLAMLEMLQVEPAQPGDVESRGDIWNEDAGYETTTKFAPNDPNAGDRNACRTDRPTLLPKCLANVSDDTCYIVSRSRHPGAVQCVMLDNSVHTVSDDIELSIWQALSTHAGDEIVEFP